MSIAVVTGGAGGIGAATCRTLGQAGHIVAIIDVEQARMAALEAELNGEGVTAFSVAADITDRAAVTSMADAISARGDVGVLV